MDEKIAKALVQDLIRHGKQVDTIRFHDNENVYIVKVTSEKVLNEQIRKGEGMFVSSAPAGTQCGCCGGSGRS